MFCADYIAAFFYHGALNVFLINSQSDFLQTKTILSPGGYFFSCGGISGLLAACSIYPFDFVRRGVIVNSKAQLRHGLSTVPYAAVFFGLYFSQRNQHSLSSQFLWANLSGVCAMIAEAPFDKAKLAMMGSRKTLLAVNGLYVPFGAMMLVMYDKALLKYHNQNHQPFAS